MELFNLLASLAGSAVAIAGFLGLLWGKVKPVVASIERLADLPERVDALQATAELSKNAHLNSHRDRLRQAGNYYVERGYIDSDDFDAFDQLHDSYKALGGNGSIDRLYSQVKALPATKEN